MDWLKSAVWGTIPRTLWRADSLRNQFRVPRPFAKLSPTTWPYQRFVLYNKFNQTIQILFECCCTIRAREKRFRIIRIKTIWNIYKLFTLNFYRVLKHEMQSDALSMT